MEEAIALHIGPKSYSGLMLIAIVGRASYLSDSLYGNLLRYHHAVDPDVLQQLRDLLEGNKKMIPLAINECAVLNIVAACDIVRKMFACDAFDVVTKDCGITLWDKAVVANLIDFSNFMISDLLRQGTFKQKIEELLIQLDENIQPV